MKKILSVFFILIILAACSEVTRNDYKFIGESEHWEAEYSYKGTEKWGKKKGKLTYSNEDSYEFILKYKGTLEELSSIKNLKYSYKTNYSSGYSEDEFNEPPKKVIFISNGSSTGSAKVNKDEVIQVNVKWGDLEESFELHNKSK